MFTWEYYSWCSDENGERTRFLERYQSEERKRKYKNNKGDTGEAGKLEYALSRNPNKETW